MRYWISPRDLHTSKRMHFIEDRSIRSGVKSGVTCIRQNVCTSLRSNSLPTSPSTVTLHTSKRMHFIEECGPEGSRTPCRSCIRQNVCTSLRSVDDGGFVAERDPCIRQNVCTSLRTRAHETTIAHPQSPCIRQNVCTSLRSAAHATGIAGRQPCIRQNVCTSLRSQIRGYDLSITALHTSKRMHLIEEESHTSLIGLKTFLHTSKRMHFIEE